MDGVIKPQAGRLLKQPDKVLSQKRFPACKTYLAKTHAPQNLKQPGNFLITKQVLPGFIGNSLGGHAVKTSEVAPVGNSNAHIVYRPVKGVFHGRIKKLRVAVFIGDSNIAIIKYTTCFVIKDLIILRRSPGFPVLKGLYKAAPMSFD
jgi:hypothetical protein